MIIKDLESELTVKQLNVDIDSVELYTGSSVLVEISAEFYDGHIEIITNNAIIDNPNPDVATLTEGLVEAIGAGEVNFTVINVRVNNRDPYARNEAEDFDQESGTQTESTTDTGGGENVGFIEDGDWLRFNGIDFGDGVASFQARVASSSSGGDIQLRLDRRTGKLIGTCSVSGTGGWQSWKTIKCPVSEVTGIHDLYLVFDGGSSYLLNINWWTFSDEVVVGMEDVSVLESEVISTEYYSLTGQKINNLDNLTGILSDGTISTTKFFKDR